MLKIRLALAASALLLASAVLAQQPAPNLRMQDGLQVPAPHYVSIPLTIDINAPIDKVWAKVGPYCAIGEWLTGSCTMLSGNEGDFGAVRSVGNEVMVGKTKYSYTYGQAPREGVTYNLYHGTLEAVPLTAKTTRLNYTLFFDNSMLADDAAREADLASRRTRFTQALRNMKILAEGGALPAGSGSASKPPTAPLMSPAPHYVSIPMTVTVNAPVDKVWARIGKFCDIGEWGIPGCKITSGTDGEFGVVRTIGNEVLVGKTQYSYVYTQPLRVAGTYIMYHGDLEARALTPSTTQLNYTLVYDNSHLADDAAREKDMTNRRTRFTGMLINMKTLSEGGKLAPDALTPARPAAATAPR